MAIIKVFLRTFIKNCIVPRAISSGYNLESRTCVCFKKGHICMVRINVSHFTIRDTFKRTSDSKKRTKQINKIVIQKICKKKKT